MPILSALLRRTKKWRSISLIKLTGTPSICSSGDENEIKVTMTFVNVFPSKFITNLVIAFDNSVKVKRYLIFLTQKLQFVVFSLRVLKLNYREYVIVYEQFRMLHYYNLC